MKKRTKQFIQSIIYLVFLEAKFKFKLAFIVDSIVNVSIKNIFRINRGIKNIFWKKDQIITNGQGKFRIVAGTDMYDILRSHYEQELYPYFSALGGVFIDVGANIGKYTIYMGNMYPNTKIYSIEPNKRVYDYLNSNVLLNKNLNISTYNIGFGSQIEEKDLYVPEGLYGCGRVLDKFKFDLNGKKINKTKIQLIRFDDFITNNNIQYEDIQLIKIDVEGFEKDVLYGAENLLENIRKCRLIIEIFENSEEIIGYLGKYNFRLIKKVCGDNYIFEKI